MSILLAHMIPMAWTNKWRRSSIGANKLWRKWMHFWRKSISAVRIIWEDVAFEEDGSIFEIK